MAHSPFAPLEVHIEQICGFLTPGETLRAAHVAKGDALAKKAASDVIWEANVRRVFGLLGAAARQGPSGEDAGPQKAFFQWQAAALDLGLATEDVPLQPEACVVVKDVQGMPEINGLEGTCVKWSMERGRWQVRLGSGESKLFKPQNLQARAGQQLVAPLPSARWIAVWGRLRFWLANNAKEAAGTLRPPAHADDFKEVRETISEKAEAAVLDIWRIADGQQVPVDAGIAQELNMMGNDDWSTEEWSHGLFGGYAVYDHEVSMAFLPLKSAMLLTKFLHNRIPAIKEMHPTKLAFTASFNFVKILFVDVCDGSVFAWTRRPSPQLEPAVPAGVAGGADGLLRWVEEYARRLEEGLYAVMPFKPEQAPRTTGINLFPVAGPDFSACVTQGVEVSSACIYMPEHPQGWTYCIAFRLVGDEASRGYKTCQLDVRHWEIQQGARNPEHVRGEGVVGLYPILGDGGWFLNQESDPHRQYNRDPGFIPGTFRYQSCSGRSPEMYGTFAGDLTFVPGTRQKPTGAAFQVRLGAFRLCVPEYMY